MDEELLAQAHPAGDVVFTAEGDVESETQNNPVAVEIPRLISQASTRAMNVVTTGSADPTPEQRLWSAMIKLPFFWFCLFLCLALPIYWIVVGMEYNGVVSICRRWAEWLIVAGFTWLLSGLLFLLMCGMGAIWGDTNFFFTIVFWIWVLVFGFDSGWYGYGTRMYYRTFSEAKNECPSSLIDCFRAYVYLIFGASVLLVGIFTIIVKRG